MKRLIVCLDGTWNAPDTGEAPTNVVKIMRAVAPSGSDARGAPVPQIVFYDRGVGTGDIVDKVKGGLVGAGLDTNVLDGYRFLANNYEPGDEIYLFGFSRGAFTARSLAGFIGRVGLAAKARLYILQDLWAYNRSCRPGRPPPPLPPHLQAAMKHGHPEVPVKCVGVWDTVGALGIPGEALRFLNRGRYEFHDVTLGGHIEVALHVVAIDEQREPFRPTLWEPPRTPPPRPQLVEQVWFPGVHSNVGGSYPDARLSDLALHWMIRRTAAATGLTFDPGYLTARVDGNAQGRIYESRTALYQVSRLMPYVRLIGQNPVPREWWRRWIKRTSTRADGRPHAGEMLHRSALDRHRNDPDYRPANLVAALAQGAPYPLPVVGYDGDYPGNPRPPVAGL